MLGGVRLARRESLVWGSAFALLAIFAGIAGDAARAAAPCEPLFGHLVSIDGTVQLQRSGEAAFRPATLNAPLCREDTVRVGQRSRAAISLVNDAVLRLDQNTTLKLLSVSVEEDERSLFDLVLGAIQSFSRRPRRLAINTPYLNATIEGTEFALRVRPDSSEVTVIEGTVVAANDDGRVEISAGEAAQARPNEAPVKRIVARPQDAVQWGLYYPPVLAGGGDARSAAGRAAALLNVGRVEEARTEINRAIGQNPNDAQALALRAVIGVVQNRRNEALADAAQAVELDPQDAAPRIALSYAQQSLFRLDDARRTLLDAVKHQPGNALAWARLSELQLSLGDRDEALAAAERAVSISPDVERAQTVLGFAALALPDTAAAKEAFTKGIAAHSSAPLPRFGLGLAKIREGNLTEGRKDIEIAVGLDSQNALLRSYLGKAYFEEKRDPLDAQQLEIAKKLDPRDPTPYLYDAIRKQTENRPGAALEDLRESIARNDNRAVYRGRQQLDQDRAARGNSLARVYNDLGFNQLGLNEATKSLTLDPSNAAAHRFLSDTYGSVRRREISRVSELLQAQLLQDININPVQPSISETNLNIVTGGGPATTGFNEFTPLFERNQAQLNVSGLAGNNDTFGGEGVISVVQDELSLSAGAFSYRTDGFRENNDIDHDIYNIFAQVAVSTRLNLQAEVRRRRTDEGDLALNFEPDAFAPSGGLNFRRELDQDIARAGVRISPNPWSDVLLSYIFSDREEATENTVAVPPIIPFPPGSASSQRMFDDEGHQAEAQYIFDKGRLNAMAGLSYAFVDRRVDAATQTNIPPFPPFATSETIDSEIRHWRPYFYLNLKYPEALTWTLGVSYDNYDEGDLDVSKVNPKFGVQWKVAKDVTLRGTLFTVVKPALVANRTIEPTQIAGFNQFFDDANATRSFVRGIGADWEIHRDLHAGIEASWRDLEAPFSSSGGATIFEDEEEQAYRAYLYWQPDQRVAVKGEVVYDRFTTGVGTGSDVFNFPLELETISVPLSVRYFHPSGFFAGLGVTYVDQKVRRSSAALLPDGKDDFVIVDASVGWRLPNRRGKISLEVNNLFDQEFNYQDDSFREFRDEPSIGPYIPEMTLLLRASLSF